MRTLMVNKHCYPHMRYQWSCFRQLRSITLTAAIALSSLKGQASRSHETWRFKWY